MSGKLKEYEDKYIKPIKDREAKENEKIMKELDLAEKAKWDREFQDQIHKKEVAK